MIMIAVSPEYFFSLSAWGIYNACDIRHDKKCSYLEYYQAE